MWTRGGDEPRSRRSNQLLLIGRLNGEGDEAAGRADMCTRDGDIKVRPVGDNRVDEGNDISSIEWWEKLKQFE